MTFPSDRLSRGITFCRIRGRSTTRRVCLFHTGHYPAEYVCVHQSISPNSCHCIKLRESLGDNWQDQRRRTMLSGTSAGQSVASAVSNKVKLLSCIFMRQAFYRALTPNWPEYTCRVLIGLSINTNDSMITAGVGISSIEDSLCNPCFGTKTPRLFQLLCVKWRYIILYILLYTFD